MKGLLRNNFYASLSNIKLFSGVMLFLGIFVVAMDNTVPSLLIGYLLLSIIGFSLLAIASLRKESTTKWAKYKVTTPVKRTEIVKSYFLSQFFWLFVGTVLAVAVVSCSILLHGFPFDKSTDILMIFSMGMGISLFFGAIFFPLFYLVGDEKSEVLLVISLLLGVGIIMIIVKLINAMFNLPMTEIQLLIGAIIIILISLAAYLFSYPLTGSIFKRKEIS